MKTVVPNNYTAFDLNDCTKLPAEYVGDIVAIYRFELPWSKNTSIEPINFKDLQNEIGEEYKDHKQTLQIRQFDGKNELRVIIGPKVD